MYNYNGTLNATLASGLGGGGALSGGMAMGRSPGRQPSQGRSNGARNGDSGGFTFDYSAAGGTYGGASAMQRPRSNTWQQRPSNSGAGGGGGGPPAPRLSNSGMAGPLYSNHSGNFDSVPGSGRRPSTSGGWDQATAGAKEPLSQRLAQVQAVYAAAKFNRSLDSILQSGTSALRPEAQAVASRTAAAAASQRGPPNTPPRREGQRPTGFTCYLCGQQYGSQSLFMHIPQCQKKWIMVESQKPRREQRPLPPPPPELASGYLPTRAEEAQEFNSRMYQYWDKVSLVACPICARTFRPDAFEKHAKVCTPSNPGGPLGPNKHAPPPGAARPGTSSGAGAGRGGGGMGGGGGGGMGARPTSGYGGGGGGGTPARREGERPRAYCCYLCGQQFGSQSLKIHIPQCYEKWLRVESGKPPKERRPPPPPPPELDEPLPTTSAGIDEFNSKMFGAYNGVSLTPCPNCGRTMRPEALKHHLKACTPDRPMGRQQAGAGGGGGAGAANAAAAARAGGGGGGGEYDEYGAGELEPCAHCGRKMRPEALVKHNRMCTAAKPMKGLAPKAPAGGAARPGSSAGPGAGGGGGGGGGDYGDDGGGPEPPKGAYSLPPDAGGGGYDDEGDERVQCGSCGRRFAPDAYAKHSRVCAKVFAGKRKVFNAAAKRVAGTEAAAYFNPRSAPPPQRPQPPAGPAPGGRGGAGAGAGGRPGPRPGGGRGGGGGMGGGGGGNMPKWKAQSLALRQAMADMRQVTAAMARGEDIRNIPVRPSAPDPSLVPCPHCGRRYSAQAAERHIPHCAGIVAKPKFLKAGTGGAGKGAPDSKALPRW
ncbi:hypothetical protein HYH03_018622 [Edaphochlamys debaryana]|uniref:C2HC/C3H-type domain-containing protein n=1 Tax=Edaphochlamys debaryana TaxID=47281 RepID=A0A835XGP2_9CHLO|nr:hypothetical protein HYH03_018622 [Edaphochlamys debaryana]|eukprot:KAG2482453.1 hypothetical protein HYH03_018622 [Edaphochlamys debaryana]